MHTPYASQLDVALNNGTWQQQQQQQQTVPAVLITVGPNRTTILCSPPNMMEPCTTVCAEADRSIATYCACCSCRLVVGLVLQALLWAFFGVRPLQGLQNAAVPAASLAALLMCGASQCAYNAASFKVRHAAA
jgi:hypothetical protein